MSSPRRRLVPAPSTSARAVAIFMLVAPVKLAFGDHAVKVGVRCEIAAVQPAQRPKLGASSGWRTRGRGVAAALTRALGCVGLATRAIVVVSMVPLAAALAAVAVIVVLVVVAAVSVVPTVFLLRQGSDQTTILSWWATHRKTRHV